MTVKTHPLLTSERITILKKVESKKCVFDSLTELLVKGQNEVNKNEIFDALIAREKLGNTCIGGGIAIPRAQLKITNPRAALLILKKGLDINSVDKKPIKLFFALLVPENEDNDYSDLIYKINRLLTADKNQDLFNSKNDPEFMANRFQNLLSLTES
jgi:PTS system nitrogen regulatory IIA component